MEIPADRFCQCFGRESNCNDCAELALAAMTAVLRAGERDLERAHRSHTGQRRTSQDSSVAATLYMEGCGEDCDCSHRVPGSNRVWRAETLLAYPIEAPCPEGAENLDR